MILLLGHYRDPNPARAAELMECLRRNRENPHIHAIHLLAEGPPEEVDTGGDPKITVFPHGRRVTYRALFDHASQRLGGETIIVANADIFFDETLARVLDHSLVDSMLCLSRWDEQPAGPPVHFARPDSQDAWIFRAPIRPFSCDFHLGILGCDNRLAFEAARAGLNLLNPSRSIRARHLHLSGVRHHSERDRLSGGYRNVPILDEPAPPPQWIEPGGNSTIFALTSLSPAPASEAAQKEAIRSWRAAGLSPVTFHHPSEAASIRGRYDIPVVEVHETTEAQFGRPFVPIHALLRFAQEKDAAALLINADITLQLKHWEMKRLRHVAAGGLCYFIRHNHDGDVRRAKREPYGIDAFLLHGRHASLFPASFLSMGQPFWDYWLPHTFAAAGKPVYCVEYPVAFHRNHARRWSDAAWHACALEFDRLTGVLGADRSMHGCTAMSLQVRQGFDRHRIRIAEKPEPIRTWVQRTFTGAAPKVFFELGAHDGSDTVWLATLPNVTVHAFEPDPRNHPPARPNVHLSRAAIAEVDGRGPFVLSKWGWNREWTYSSSLRRPKNHLQRYPVSFGDTIEVETVALDSYARRHGVEAVDFIWADIQGAEGDMARGGHELLARTHYLFTEYSDDEMYEGQSTLGELLAMLPGYRVLELYEDDVLLENTRFGERPRSAPPPPKAPEPPPAPVAAPVIAAPTPAPPVAPIVAAGAPLVTCVMPTYNRRPFIERAIRYFQRQTYPSLELLILDDGTDSIRDLVPEDPRIRYVRLDGRRTIGAKRNLGCEEARGEYIAHWDDDDWYPPDRIAIQVEALRRRGGGICGSSQELFYEPQTQRAWRYRWIGSDAMLVGASLLYPKSLWMKTRFADLQIGEDVRFVRQAGAALVDLLLPSLCVGIVHPGNTSPKTVQGRNWEEYPLQPLQMLLGADADRYRARASPLVSCVMVTCDRPAFVALSIERFLAQDIAAKELIIVDDGVRSAEAAARAAGARYLRPPRRLSIGAKRNLACEAAQGEIVAHWDDDDFYAPDRLRRQLEPIAAGEADITGLTSRFVLQLPGRRFFTLSPALHRRMFVGDVHGGTLMFRRSIYAGGARFPDVNLAEDAAFIREATARGHRLKRVENDGAFVYVRHGNNAWRFDAGRFLDPGGWLPIEPPRSFTPELLAAYESAAEQSAATAIRTAPAASG